MNWTDVISNGVLVTIIVYFIRRLILEIDNMKKDIKSEKNHYNEKISEFTKDMSQKIDNSEHKLEKKINIVTNKIEILSGKINDLKIENVKQNEAVKGHHKILKACAKIYKSHDSKIRNLESKAEKIGKDLYIIRSKKD